MKSPIWLGSLTLTLLVGGGCGCGEQGERAARVRERLEPAFSDVTQAAGISGGHGSWGGIWADVDGDGDPDLFTLGHLQRELCGANQYWRNNGDRTFTDVTLAVGIDDHDGTDLNDPDCMGDP